MAAVGTPVPKFAIGDAVTLKGQSIVLTVSPPPANPAGELVTRDGWIWVAYASQMGLGFHHLAIDTLVKKSARG